MLQRYALLSTLVTRAFCLPFQSQLQTSLATHKPLRFTQDGTFQLAVFEDLHYGEDEDTEWGPQQDENSGIVTDIVLSFEAPQLVVLNGDLITGENTHPENSSLYLDELVRPFVEHGLSWASTYGNHDSDFNLSREAIFERERQYPNSLTQQMVHSPDAGLTNYFLPVLSADPNDPEPQVILWFFDSRGGYHYQQQDKKGNRVGQPGWVDESVVKWFTQANTEIQATYKRSIPSLAFVHIPINAMAAFQKQGVDPHTEPGLNDDNPLAQQGIVDGEYIGSDIPFMTALLETPQLMGLFSAHDHGDDWCFSWRQRLPSMNLTGNGLPVCFGRHSGYGGYGSWARGARQILLQQDSLGDGVETWIRLQDGEVTGRVRLNGTYGTDRYDEVRWLSRGEGERNGEGAIGWVRKMWSSWWGGRGACDAMVKGKARGNEGNRNGVGIVIENESENEKLGGEEI